MSATSNSPLINSLPRIGITIGDPAGIGPEIVLKSLSDQNLLKILTPVIIGDGAFLRQTAEALDLPVSFKGFGSAGAIDTIELVDLQNLPDDVRSGYETAATGAASGQYIEKAVELWRSGTLDAIATAPISKKALNSGGYDFPGHTEFLANLTDTHDFAMSFFADKLRVVLLSTHLSLVDAIRRVTSENMIRLIEFTNKNLESLLKRSVKIAVAGLNPHASEGGMFGSEESREITPAIEHCRSSLGIDVWGAFSPDTIFLRGHRGEFDVVIACYHDQATIAVKSLSFGSGVNVTLGLPLIRTSVDHGTAIDIAGKGIADESSMIAAIKLAAELANIQRRTANV